MKTDYREEVDAALSQIDPELFSHIETAVEKLGAIVSKTKYFTARPVGSMLEILQGDRFGKSHRRIGVIELKPGKNAADTTVELSWSKIAWLTSDLDNDLMDFSPIPPMEFKFGILEKNPQIFINILSERLSMECEHFLR